MLIFSNIFLKYNFIKNKLNYIVYMYFIFFDQDVTAKIMPLHKMGPEEWLLFLLRELFLVPRSAGLVLLVV